MLHIMRNINVPANTALPLWEDIFPNLIRPDRLVISESFQTAPGPLQNRLVQSSSLDPVAKWAAAGAFVVHPDGYVYSNAASSTLGQVAITSLGTGVKGQVMLRGRWGGGGYLGVVIRMTSSGGAHWRALLSDTNLHLQERANDASQVRQEIKPFTPVVGQIYDLMVSFDEGHLSLTCDGVTVTYENAVSNQEKMMVGLFLYNTNSAPLHQVHAFHAGV